jgi:2-iminobutanoate/2-iminopropanoate deaminase
LSSNSLKVNTTYPYTARLIRTIVAPRVNPSRTVETFISAPVTKMSSHVVPGSAEPNWLAAREALETGSRILPSLPPFDPQMGEILQVPIERQAELVLNQLKLCLEAAGTSLANVVKCNIYCTSVDKFAAVNLIYAKYFPTDPPARIFICVTEWPGPFDIEIDCVAIS